MNEVQNEVTKSGYVVMVGRPNVGKSTLLNALIGEKISIVSPKPQTTRWQILGIKIAHHAQMIYVDTPGIHQDEKRAMNRYLNRLSGSMINEADVIVFIIDATRFDKEDQAVLNQLKTVNVPVILAINKMDLLADKNAMLPLMEKMHAMHGFTHIIPLSAKTHDNVAHFEKIIAELLPDGPMLFPEDQLTDKSARFLAAEIIREKLIQLTEEEVPYTTTVEIEQFNEDEKLTEISAIIWVERVSQKAIVIGKNGEKLKKVGTRARLEIETLLDAKVFLRLWVKVKENWTDDEKAMRGLGYE